MKKFSLLLILFLPVINLYAQTANEIIARAENILKGESAHGTIEMEIVTPDYERTLKMESWWVGNEKALIVIEKPRREAGNKTLKIGNEMWNYLRNTETTIKIPPSMMLQSWNGSDFTNDDLVRESNLEDDYEQSIIADEEVDGEMCWKILLVPKPDAPVVWGKLHYWVRKSDYIPAVVEYYDEKGKLMRYMEFSEIAQFGGRKLPAKWAMIDNLKKGNSTTLKVLDMAFDVKIPERKFSFQELERGN